MICTHFVRDKNRITKANDIPRSYFHQRNEVYRIFLENQEIFVVCLPTFFLFVKNILDFVKINLTASRRKLYWPYSRIHMLYFYAYIMIDTEQLCAFLVRAKTSTYASGDKAKKIIETDTSTSLFYKEWDRTYHDNYFGGEPYGGREIVFYKNQPVYIMTYYWYVYEHISDLKRVYTFLQHALSLLPVNYPYRWPQLYNENNLSYINDFTGEIDNFSGEESIAQDGKEIYKAKYIGGVVDQRR